MPVGFAGFILSTMGLGIFSDVISYITSQQEYVEQEIQAIYSRTTEEIDNINKVYRKEIVASQAFGFIALAFMIAVPAVILINDLGKLAVRSRRIAKLKKNKVGAKTSGKHELIDGRKLCENISRDRIQISDFDSFFLKSLVRMHSRTLNKKSF